MQEAPQGNAIKPWWKQKTFWASALSVLLALPTFVEQLAPFLNEEQRQKAMALSALAAALAAIFARMGGVQAAQQLTGRQNTAGPAGRPAIDPAEQGG